MALNDNFSFVFSTQQAAHTQIKIAIDTATSNAQIYYYTCRNSFNSGCFGVLLQSAGTHQINRK